MMKKIFIFSVFLVLNHAFSSLAQKTPAFLKTSSKWVDSVFNSLSPEERIGQLFMVQAYSNGKNNHCEDAEQLIKNYKVGGVIFFQGSPTRQAQLTNLYQKLSKTPLLIAMDAEWGLAMRLDSTIAFPKQMQLGAIKNDSLIYEMASEIARQCHRLGVQVSFAPVVDINNNPKNVVIGKRSFGSDKLNVARKSMMYMAGLQDNLILPTAKHFPGHGDTNKDSHKTLPTIKAKRKRLDALELYPFKQLINNGLSGIMVAHLNVPALDKTAHLPSSLSKKVVTDLLRNELKFKGLVFTDALGMKGVTKYYGAGSAAVKAILAGNDVLLMPENVKEAIEAIKKAVADGTISQEQIDEHCRRILAAKEWVGLKNYQPIKTENLYQDLNTDKAKQLNQKLIEASVSVIYNPDNTLPFKSLDTKNIACVDLDSDSKTEFQQTCQLYTTTNNFVINSSKLSENVIDTLSRFNTVILNFHQDSIFSKETLNLVSHLLNRTNVVINVLGNPQFLGDIDNIKKAAAIVVSYGNENEIQKVSAQILFGGIPTTSSLSVDIVKEENIDSTIAVHAAPTLLASTTNTFIETKEANEELIFEAGLGIENPKTRLKYGTPQELGIDTSKLAEINGVIARAIKEHVLPGCEILAAKDGTVFYQKSFGYFTYTNTHAVCIDDIYDLASVTKVTATLPCLMKLVDEKKLDINAKMSQYLSILRGTNKKNMIVKDVLLHQAKLQPGLAFYKQKMKNYQLDTNTFSKKRTARFSVQVAENLFITPQYKDTMLMKIAASSLERKKEYKYSDLGFILFREVIEVLTKTPIEKYVESNFYKKLGATTMTYKPLEHFDKKRIAPTEYDVMFRNQILQGYVHDPTAAMMGGVSGHAGLFSDANDLAKLMQMYLQMGEYGGERFISEKTMKEFTSAPEKKKRKTSNRRGLGFDKPILNAKGKPSYSWLSAKSFGHTGFTGTLVWADPDTKIVYVFLSNRVYPDANNHRISKEQLREEVQHIIYKACGY